VIHASIKNTQKTMSRATVFSGIDADNMFVGDPGTSFWGQIGVVF
jgi:hypothetical protein